MWLIAGLGNPGREYADNRHNIGFMVADELCARWRFGGWRSKFGGEVASGDVGDEKVILLKPMEYMNTSGVAVKKAAVFHKVDDNHIVILHDEIDLDFARIRIKQGGGHGGHNGLRSLHEQLGPDYLRVRCGVGHPGHKDRVVGHVLGPFSKPEQAELPSLIALAADATQAIIQDGVISAMNRFNR